METPRTIDVAGSARRRWIWLGAVLLGAGLLGHVLAAQAIGGYYVAYRDHLAGFLGLTIVTGAILAGLGSRLWKGRHDITVLTLGVLQALIGLVVYINRFNIG